MATNNLRQLTPAQHVALQALREKLIPVAAEQFKPYIREKNDRVSKFEQDMTARLEGCRMVERLIEAMYGREAQHA